MAIKLSTKNREKKLPDHKELKLLQDEFKLSQCFLILITKVFGKQTIYFFIVGKLKFDIKKENKT